MNTLQEEFISACNTESDIFQHLPLFNILAKTCKHVTEFGVRWGTSSTAWLNNDVVLRAYDIKAFPEAVTLFDKAKKQGKDAELIIADTAAIADIEETDLLFIDSLHTADHILKELRFHHRVRKYLIFHDTVTFGDIGEDGGPGVMHAVQAFLHSNPNWVVLENRTNCKGLMVLTRKHLL
jgi:cephalosporin hydroxylase